MALRRLRSKNAILNYLNIRLLLKQPLTLSSRDVAVLGPIIIHMLPGQKQCQNNKKRWLKGNEKMENFNVLEGLMKQLLPIFLAYGIS